MKLSTIKSKIKFTRLLAVLFWLLVWQVACMCVKQEILIASPVSVISRLSELVFEAGFWKAIAFSLFRILSGFLIAAVTATIAAVIASRIKLFRELMSPLISVINVTPIASFIIIALIWIESKNLSALIAFLMVFPIVYSNIMEGIATTDKKLLEMAKLFRVPYIKQIRYIYFSHVMPFFRSACAISLGLAWKSGIAAEVIGIPKGSMGEKLYNAKVYLQTPDLFAWTIVIILVSIVFEKLIIYLIKIIIKRSERA